MEKARRKEYSGAVLLRLRGFLHAFHLVEMTYQLGLVEMTTKKVPSSQSKSCHSERSEESPGKVNP